MTKFKKQVARLNHEQVMELADVLAVAGVAYEMKGDWREIFRRMTYKYYAGVAHKVYKTLATMGDSCIGVVIRGFTEETT